jgi:D-3-phosphoglycerate dehydrogenase
MAKILINDGIHPTGAKMLQDAGHTISLEKIEQADLASQLPDFDAICVRSATKVRTDLIDVCPNLKAIGRGGVGLDNIDVDHAKSRGIAVLNTPAASSRSVAELAFAHLLSVARSLYHSNRNMPTKGNTEFKSLKKAYSKGFELEGKTLGIIGFGRIGQSTAEIALGMGMNVLAVDPIIEKANVRLGGKNIGMDVEVDTVEMDEMLASADIITLHIPNIGRYVLSSDEFSKMKEGVILINCSRGGTVDENAMLEALKSGKVGAAGIDVFENEPTPREDILSHPKISLTPHTGASTGEAQEKIGIELAEKLIAALG